MVGNDQIREKGCNLSIPLYVRGQTAAAGRVAEEQALYGKAILTQAIANWQESSQGLCSSMDGLLKMLEGIDKGQ